MPFVVSAALTATPKSAPRLGSVTLSTWPAGRAKSTRLETNVPTAPTGAPASSLIAVSTGLLLASSTGASLTAFTVRAAVSVAVEKAVVPPLVEVSASVPLTPLV